MLQRDDPGGPIVITQPAHAWVSGQLARAWGNAEFGTFAPWEEVCLGAEQHDIGWTTWEPAPTLNPQTGRPYTFLNLPGAQHRAIFAAAVSLILAQGRYAALLTSLHIAGLIERFGGHGATPEDNAAEQEVLRGHHAAQEDLLASLRADPHYAPDATPEAVARNRALVRTWDSLSLACGMGVRDSITVADVPTAAGATSLIVTAVPGAPDRLAVVPWPFARERVEVRVDGRRLPGTFDDEGAMRAALAAAAWVTVQVELMPG